MPTGQLTDLYTYPPDIHLYKVQEGKRQIGTLFRDENGRYYKAMTNRDIPAEENQYFAAVAMDARGTNYQSEGGNVYHLVMSMTLTRNIEECTSIVVTAQEKDTTQSTIRQNTAQISCTSPQKETAQAHHIAQVGNTTEE